MTTILRARPNGADGTPDGSAPPAGARAGLAGLGMLLVAGAWFMPLWQATLLAPQYPGGLSMQAYGRGVTGDISEIDSLNHYVGMRAFNPADVPEMALWPYVVVVAVIAVVIGLWSRHSWPGRVARVYLWVTPGAVLGMIQLRLYQYGHDLDPMAALRLDPFTPWVVGPTKVWNFTTWARPGLGLVVLLLAAFVVSFGPRLVTWWRARGHRTTAVGLLVPLVLAATAAPAVAAGSGHGDHDDHNPVPHTMAPVRAIDRSGPVLPTDGPVLVDHPHAGALADLLAEVPDGGRLVLGPGTYHGPVVIDRPVTIEGEGLPVVVGDGTGNVITVRAAGTVLRGIGVRGSGPGPGDNPAGIRIEADDVRVEGVVVGDAYTGIAIAGAAGAVVVDSVVRGRAAVPIGDDAHAVEHDAGAARSPTAGDPAGAASHATQASGADDTDHAGHDHDAGASGARGDGIWLHDSKATLVRGNLVQDVRDGIYLSFAQRTLVDTNQVRASRYAVHSMYARDLALAENLFRDNMAGAVLMYGGEVLALRNTIRDNRSASTGFGILLKDVTDVQAVQNVLVDNRVGIHLDGPADSGTETVLDANTIARNQVGVAAYSSARAAFRANSFADNLVQVLSRGGTLDGISWMDRGAGNYWSTYRGYESTLRPGRGAVPHVEGGAVDRLLLRSPELVAIADTPAMRLLRSIEERWGTRTPVAIDHGPLTRPVSPPVRAAAGATPAVPAAAVTLAALLLLPSVLVLWRPRHRHLTLRRLLHATPA